jgi:hypothetical protein
VAVVNQRFVDYFGLGGNAVGTRIDIVEGDVRDVEIVGVVANAKYNNVKDPVRAQLFRPRDQLEAAEALTFYVRHAGEPESVIAEIRNVVARLDESLPIASMQTMDRQVADNVFPDRFMSRLAAALAVLATLFAVVGIYGTLSYVIAQRTREIGLRIALGAPPDKLYRMFLRHVGAMASIGGALGIGGPRCLARRPAYCSTAFRRSTRSCCSAPSSSSPRWCSRRAICPCAEPRASTPWSRCARSSGRLRLLQRQRHDLSAVVARHRDDDVLLAIDHVGHRAAADGARQGDLGENGARRLVVRSQKWRSRPTRQP